MIPQSQTKTLVYQKVTPMSAHLALKIRQQTWPHEDFDLSSLVTEASDHDDSNVSWLVYHDKDLIGITGVFTFDADEPGYDYGESIWMDWFTILPAFRRQHFGRQVLLDTIDYCRQLKKHNYFRIDTTYFPNRPAVSLYDQIMPLREEYTAEDTPEKQQHYLIYSCSLNHAPLKPWNNHPLALGDSDGLIVN